MEIKKLSNSFSTGDGGGNFERHVQAVFLLALLVDNFSPILDEPIDRLDFQGKRLGYDTDDLIVTSSGKNASKILLQIKHDIEITKRSVLFQEVINAAWSDFKKDSFCVGKDKIVLATGIIVKDSIISLRYLHEQACGAWDEDDFIARIQQSNFTSAKAREKYDILKEKLKIANGGIFPSNQELWQFCKSFLLLVFDLDYQSSVNRILINSLINCLSLKDVEKVWAVLSEYAGRYNQNAASISLDNIAEDIKELFDSDKLRQKPIENKRQIVSSELWACLSLIGRWSEKNDNDVKIVEQIVGVKYSEIESTLRQYIADKNLNISFQNGIWSIRNREELFRSCMGFFSDRIIERTFEAAVIVLRQNNKRLDETSDWFPFIPEDEEFQNSKILRKGLVQGLCILSNHDAKLPCCSDYVCKRHSRQLIRDIFADRNRTAFASLADVLSLIAEINPKQYLATLEDYIQTSPTEFIQLFPPQKENALFSSGCANELIWSIESLAWDESYLVTCVRCLGEVASVLHLSEDKSKIAIKAIRDILLPWHPQTLASLDTQKNAVQALVVDMPEIGWAVIQRLLPEGSSMSAGTPKPKFIVRNIPPKMDVLPENVTELYRYYSALAVELAADDTEKLTDLVKYVDYLDEEAIERYLSNISLVADELTDEIGFALWNKLSDVKYSILLDQKEAGAPDTALYRQLCMVIDQLQPLDKCILYRRLYLSHIDEYILHEDDDFMGAWEKKDIRKTEAVLDIYKSCGLESVQDFGVQVNDMFDVGRRLGQGIEISDMQHILQIGFSEAILPLFLYVIVDGFARNHGLQALLVAGLQNYDTDFISNVLSRLPLSNELVNMAEQLLADDRQLFWEKIIPPTFLRSGDDIDIPYVVDQLLTVERAVAAVNLCGCVHGELHVSAERISHLLRTAATTESTEKLDARSVKSLIQKLQDTEKVDIQELGEIELIYLPWIDRFSSVRPRALFYKIANDATFFCELLQLCYKKRHEDMHDADIPKISPEWIERLSHIFYQFRVVPGTDWDGVLHEDIFVSWLEQVKAWALENDRFEIAMQTVGQGLAYARADEDGVLCDIEIIKALNGADAKHMRTGYIVGIYNRRGVHFVDPEGKEELALAEKYKRGAQKAEKLGYSRYSELMKEIADSYYAEAERNILEEKQYREEYEEE